MANVAGLNASYLQSLHKLCKFRMHSLSTHAADLLSPTHLMGDETGRDTQAAVSTAQRAQPCNHGRLRKAIFVLRTTVTVNQCTCCTYKTLSSRVSISAGTVMLQFLGPFLGRPSLTNL
jgi:hypothetical protein